MKKIALLSLAAVMLITMAACSGGTPAASLSDAQKVVDETLQNAKNFNTDALDPSIRDYLGTRLEDATFVDFMKTCNGRMEYTIGKETIDGDSATVSVDVKYIDAPTIAIALQDEVDPSTTDEAELIKLLTEKAKAADAPTLQDTIDVTLEKSGDKWTIVLTEEFVGVMLSNMLGMI